MLLTTRSLDNSSHIGMAYKYLVRPGMKRRLCRTPGGEISLRCGGHVADDPDSSSRRKVSCLLISAVALLTVAGCELGPDFHPPIAPAEAGYAPGAMVAVTASALVAEGTPQRLLAGKDIAGNWWTSFGSRQLDAFVEQALVANPNLRAAQAALRQAKETAFATEGVLLPQIDANASTQRQQFSEASVGVQGPPLIFNLFQTTLNVSYSLDVFGGKRRQIEASEAQAEYQRFQLEATYLTLTANLVATAIQVASLHGQIEATRDIVRSKRRQLGLMQGQFEAGTINKTDVLAQEAELAANSGAEGVGADGKGTVYGAEVLQKGVKKYVKQP